VNVGSFFIISINHLTILASTAMAAGLYFFSLGLYRFVRKSGPTSNKPEDMRPGARDANDSPGDSLRRSAQDNLSEQVSAPEIIRLESGTSASAAREMTQQERIAAALTRAGVNRPVAWSTADVSQRSVAVEENAPNGRLRATTEIGPHEVCPNEDRQDSSHVSLTPAWQSAVMMCAGAAIMLLSAYILLVQMQLL